MSKIFEFKNENYILEDLIKYRDEKIPLYKSGEVLNIDSGEILDISEIDTWSHDAYKEIKDIADSYGKKFKGTVRKEVNNLENEKRIRLLQTRFDDNNIKEEELKDLIKLKYGSSYEKALNTLFSYEDFIVLNKKVPPLKDSELGKFYKILMLMSSKANSLLTKSYDKRSNPINYNDIMLELQIDIRTLKRFIKTLKDNKIIDEIILKGKLHLIINPIYAYSGSIINFLTFNMFEEDIMNNLVEQDKVPIEIITLLKYQYSLNSILVEKVN